MRRTTSSAVNIAAIAATLTRSFATHAIMGVKRYLDCKREIFPA
jgi:hypothetical protein